MHPSMKLNPYAYQIYFKGKLVYGNFYLLPLDPIGVVYEML